jgi:hypothetical protein
MTSFLSYRPNMLRLVILVIMGLLWTLPMTAQENVITGTAFINDVTLNRDNGQPTLVITGELADPCTQVDTITQSTQGNTITIDVPTTRDADVMCAAVVEPFETTYTLVTTGLSAGDYMLNVNDFTTDITLTADDIANAQATSAPTDALSGWLNGSLDVMGVSDWQAVVLDELGAYFFMPSDWVLQSEQTDYGILDDAGELLALFLVVDAADSLEATLERVAELYEADSVPDESVMLGTDEAPLEAYAYAVADACQTYVVVQDDVAIVIATAPDVCDDDNNITNDGIQVMLDTLFIGE